MSLDLSSLTNSWGSYPKIYNIGHVYLADYFDSPVQVEEKVDGSQFSFGVFNGEIKVRSRGQELITDAPEKLFTRAVETVRTLAPMLRSGWTYRGEYLAKPKHNVLAYDRAPNLNIIIFDINRGQESYLSYEEKKAEAERLGLEVVPLIYQGMITSPEQFLQFMETISVLGGQKIEGVVVKNYSKMGPDKKVLLAKYVSEAFKEVHKVEWKVQNPNKGDIMQLLAAKYKTDSRRHKAIQHLREAGILTDSPKDIGALIKEVQKDTMEECKEEIIQELYRWAKPQLMRMIVAGLPEWYKEELVKSQKFGTEAAMQEIADLGQLQDAGEEPGHNPLIRKEENTPYTKLALDGTIQEIPDELTKGGGDLPSLGELIKRAIEQE